MAFSKETRTQTIDQLKQTELDLLIVGGGITGAGVAIQAAASGLKTGLIEMHLIFLLHTGNRGHR